MMKKIFGAYKIIPIKFSLILLTITVPPASLAYAADLVWTSEVKIDSFATNAVGGGGPKLAVDGTGNVMAVWTQSDGTNQNIYANRYVPGSGWGSATLIETSSMPADSPQIVADANGNFIAVWRQAWKTVNGALYGVYANRYSAGTGWGTSSVVWVDTARTDISANGPEQLAIDGSGNAIVVWSVYDWSWNHTSVRASRYVAGSGWGASVNLSSEAVQAAFSPKVAMDANGNALAVWRQDTGTTKSTQGIHAIRYSVGTGWGTPTLIESAANTVTRSGDGPQIAFDPQGNAIAVWYQYSKPGIYANRYVAGSGWGSAQAIPDTGTTSYDEAVQLAIDKNGNAIALWNQYGGVLYANRYVAGAGWGTTAIIESNGTDYSGQIAFDQNGNAIAIWGNYSCNSYNIQATQYVVGTGWGAVKRCYEGPNFVNTTKDYTSQPQIVIDNKGNSTAIWVRGVGSSAVFYAATSTTSTTITPTTSFDCVFAWAEQNYPELFSPAAGKSKTFGDYYYRYYSKTDSYLAAGTKDNHFYYVGLFSGNKILDIGAASLWTAAAGCK